MVAVTNRGDLHLWLALQWINLKRRCCQSICPRFWYVCLSRVRYGSSAFKEYWTGVGGALLQSVGGEAVTSWSPNMAISPIQLPQGSAATRHDFTWESYLRSQRLGCLWCVTVLGWWGSTSRLRKNRTTRNVFSSYILFLSLCTNTILSRVENKSPKHTYMLELFGGWCEKPGT